MKPVLTGLAAVLAGTMLAPGAASAQTNQPPPPCTDDIYRAFDFWAGEWEVFNPQGKRAGHNSITVEENGCLLVEHWKGGGGGTGQSYNFVDQATGEWRQVWVSAGATIDYSGGLNDAGEMALEGQISYRNGKKAPFRGTWTLQDDGSVRQHFQQYDAQTQTWSDWFVGIYKTAPTAE